MSLDWFGEIYSQRAWIDRLYNKHTSLFTNEDVLTKERILGRLFR